MASRFLLISLLFPASLGAQDAAAPRLDSATAVATFDSAWSRLRHTYYDPTMRGLDWDSVGRALRPEAARAASARALRQTLERMLAALGDSHLEVIPGDAARALEGEAPSGASSGGAGPGESGMTVRLVDGRLVIASIERGSAAEAAGLRSGWAVERIGGWDVDAALRSVGQLQNERGRRAATIQLAMRANALLAGETDREAMVTARDARGSLVRAAVRRRPARGELSRFGNLPPMLVRLDAERRTGEGGCVGVVRFNIWLVPVAAPFDSAMRALRDCAGIVLDLRGNPGGVGALSMGIAGYFLDSAAALGVMRMRTGELRFAVTPRRVYATGEPATPFAGRVAVVVDPLSASTSEVFAAGLQRLGRARVFGEPSAGMALPAWLTRLPDGDVLLHAVADYILPDGRRIEGAGVVPDEPVPLSREALVAGRDEAMERAVRWAGTGRSRAHP